jgi:glycosyltransferase involved in cell wall biosynthesis
MRIAHVTDFYLPRLGGIEMHVHDLATRQLAAGHDVEVITSSPATPAEVAAAGAVAAGTPGLVVHRLTAENRLPPLFNPALLRAGRALLRERRYDLVHVHAGVISPLAFSAVALAADAPTVVTAHSLLAYLQPAFRTFDAGTRWSRLPAVWTAVSDLAAQPLRRLVAPAPVHVLPNGIDPDQWQITPLPRNPDEVLVVGVMRLAARKRPRHLLAMLRHAQRKLSGGPRLRAVIVGEGPQRPWLEAYLRRHGMTGWVSLPGRMERPQIAELFARADLFVAPATLESFGIAALEARCAGLPVVARSDGGIGEFIGADGREGILADSDAQMTEAIVRLAAEPALREQIAHHNRATRPGLAWPEVLERTMDLYELAIASHPALEGVAA